MLYAVILQGPYDSAIVGPHKTLIQAMACAERLRTSTKDAWAVPIEEGGTDTGSYVAHVWAQGKAGVYGCFGTAAEARLWLINALDLRPDDSDSDPLCAVEKLQEERA